MYERPEGILCILLSTLLDLTSLTTPLLSPTRYHITRENYLYSFSHQVGLNISQNRSHDLEHPQSRTTLVDETVWLDMKERLAGTD